MPKPNISDLRTLPGIDTIGDAVIYGEGRERRQIGVATNGYVSLTEEGEKLIAVLIPALPPTPIPNNFNELALYTLNTFGVKLDQRKSLKTLKEQVAKLEREKNATVTDAWSAS